MSVRRTVRRAVLATAATFLAASAGLASAASAAAPPPTQVVTGAGNGVFLQQGFAQAGLLAGFQFDFTNGDHRIREIDSNPLAGSTSKVLGFADQNGDDPFTWRDAQTIVDRTGVTAGTAHINCSGSGGICSTALSRPAGDPVFVLTGFHYVFTNGEHKLDQIQVTESSGQLTTVFKDQNGDDPYAVDVSYAYVPRARLALGEINGTGHQTGFVAVQVPGGSKVIRGFAMDNLTTTQDNNIRDLGVNANFSEIDIHYGDNNPQDSADWHYTVQYANALS